MRPLFLVVLGLLATGCPAAQAPPKLLPSPSPSASTSKPAGSCEAARLLRNRIPDLLKEGKLDRTVRVLRRADGLCPSEHSESWAPLVTSLAELGAWDEVLKTADAIDAAQNAPEEAKRASKAARTKAVEGKKAEAAPEPADLAIVLRRAFSERDKGRAAEAFKLFLRVWELHPPNGQALVEAGLVASSLGNKVEAQRLFDRGRAELERAAGAPMSVEPGASPYSLRAWSATDLLADLGDGRVSIVRSSPLEERFVFAPAAVPIVFSPDGTKLVTGSNRDKVGRLWNALTGALIAELPGTTGCVQNAQFSADGSILAAGYRDGTVQVWNSATGRLIHTFSNKKGMGESFALSPDGTRIAVFSHAERGVVLWDVSNQRRVAVLRTHGLALAFSRDSTKLAATDGTVAAWFDAVTGRALSRTTLPRLDRPSNKTRSPDDSDLNLSLAVFAADTTRVLIVYHSQLSNCSWQCYQGSFLVLLDASGKIVQRVEPCAEPVLSPEGSRVACVGGRGMGDSTMRLWDLANGTQLAEVEDGFSPVFSQDGTRLAVRTRTANDTEGVQYLRAADGSRLASPPTWNRRTVTYSLTPDGFVDFVNESAPGDVVCRLNQHVFPFEVCAERNHVRGLVAKLMSDASLVDP